MTRSTFRPLAFLMALSSLLPAWAWGANFSSCSIGSVGNLSFLNYDTLNALSSASSFSVNCSKTGNGTAVYTVALSSGPGSYASRSLAGTAPLASGYSLAYNLYTDAQHTSIWGDGTGGSVTQSRSSSGNSDNFTFTVYGYVPGGQNVAPGSYGPAQITVTVSF